MAAGTRQTNTMEEILRKQLGAFADLKLADDADFDFITDLETRVLGKLRGPIDQMQQQGLTAAPAQLAGGMGGPPPQAAPMGPPPGAGATGDPNLDAIMQALAAQGGGQQLPPVPGAVPGATPPGRGPAMSPAMPNPDELRRILDQGQ